MTIAAHLSKKTKHAEPAFLLAEAVYGICLVNMLRQRWAKFILSWR
jgi:hypothetical protein